jgi:hypothetical protein
VEGRAGTADAWSAEAHLVGCALCRAELAALMAGGPVTSDLLSSVRARVLVDAHDGAASGPAVRMRHPAARRQRSAAGSTGVTGVQWHLRWVAQPVALAAVALAVVAAVGFAAATRSLAGPGQGVSWLLWLAAPPVPLVGVALSSISGEADREAELATPSGGWRLLLWRTLAVVVTAVLLASVAGWLLTELTAPIGPAQSSPQAAQTWLPVLWLLPSLALTALTLALGTWFVLPHAAAAVGGGWALAVLLPLVVPAAGGGERSSPAWSLRLLSEGAQPLWALLLVAATGVVVARCEALGRVRQGMWPSTGGLQS